MSNVKRNDGSNISQKEQNRKHKKSPRHEKNQIRIEMVCGKNHPNTTRLDKFVLTEMSSSSMNLELLGPGMFLA